MLLTHGGFIFSWQVTKKASTNNHTETLCPLVCLLEITTETIPFLCKLFVWHFSHFYIKVCLLLSNVFKSTHVQFYTVTIYFGTGCTGCSGDNYTIINLLSAYNKALVTPPLLTSLF